MKFYCDNQLDGGGWALVRRVKQGATWHPATDHLAGTQAAYGNYGGPTFDETFGRPYSSWVTTSTEFLFTTGFHCGVTFFQVLFINLHTRRPKPVVDYHLGSDSQQRSVVRR
jgi:hypothetical protein